MVHDGAATMALPANIEKSINGSGRRILSPGEMKNGDIRP